VTLKINNQQREWWGVRVRRHFGARGMSSVRYRTRLGDLKNKQSTESLMYAGIGCKFTEPSSVCVECLLQFNWKTKKPILFKVTEPNSIPYKNSSRAPKGRRTRTPPVIPLPESGFAEVTHLPSSRSLGERTKTEMTEFRTWVSSGPKCFQVLALPGRAQACYVTSPATSRYGHLGLLDFVRRNPHGQLVASSASLLPKKIRTCNPLLIVYFYHGLWNRIFLGSKLGQTSPGFCTGKEDN
jgi:hypothetical protein